MPSLRTKFTVSWDGGEPVEILTTVRDVINAVDRIPAESAGNRVALQTTLIHSALERSPDHNPPPYDEWIELLDHYDEVLVVTGVEGPTKPAPSPNGRSRSRASRAPTGDPGSTKTPAP